MWLVWWVKLLLLGSALALHSATSGEINCQTSKEVTELVKVGFYHNKECTGYPVFTVFYPLKLNCFCFVSLKDPSFHRLVSDFSCGANYLNFTLSHLEGSPSGCCTDNCTTQTVSEICDKQADHDHYTKILDNSCCHPKKGSQCLVGVPGFNRGTAICMHLCTRTPSYLHPLTHRCTE